MRIRWHRTFVFRLLIALVGFAQSASPSVAAVYEATLGMNASPAYALVHAEDGRQSGCSVVHGPECVVCAALTVLAAPPRSAAYVETDRRPFRIAPALAAGVQAPLLLAARPRAPPLV